jgi:GNAT superfamily N-acetyltransferase
MSEVIITKPRPLDIGKELAGSLQNVSSVAWAAAYAEHVPAEYIRRRFENRSDQAREKAMEDFQITSQIGNLVVAQYVDDSGRTWPVGYASAFNELAWDPMKRLTYRLLHPFKRSHVLLGELSVVPDAQHRGLGKQLLGKALEPFHDQQVPTIWVPEDGLAAKGLLTSVGFQKTSQTRMPAMSHAFGPAGAFLPETYYTAPSVETVLRATAPAAGR